MDPLADFLPCHALLNVAGEQELFFGFDGLWRAWLLKAPTLGLPLDQLCWDLILSLTLQEKGVDPSPSTQWLCCRGRHALVILQPQDSDLFVAYRNLTPGSELKLPSSTVSQARIRYPRRLHFGSRDLERILALRGYLTHSSFEEYQQACGLV